MGGCVWSGTGKSYNLFPCPFAFLKAKIHVGTTRTAVGKRSSPWHLPLWWCYLRFTPLWHTVLLPWPLFFHKQLLNTRICSSSFPIYPTSFSPSPETSGWGPVAKIPQPVDGVDGVLGEHLREKQSTSAWIFDITIRSNDTTHPLNANMKYRVFKLNKQPLLKSRTRHICGVWWWCVALPDSFTVEEV